MAVQSDTVLERASTLKAEGKPFALVTVVRFEDGAGCDPAQRRAAHEGCLGDSGQRAQSGLQAADREPPGPGHAAAVESA